VVTGRRDDCSGSTSRLVSTINGTGYLSSQVTGRTGVGAADCPWLLRAGSGQRISLSLLDFTPVGRRSSTSHQSDVENEAVIKASSASSQRCVRLAVVREVSGAYRRGDREVCSLIFHHKVEQQSVLSCDASLV